MTDTEFENEIVRLRPRLLRSAVKVTGELQGAEDLVQDALLLAWRFRLDFRGDSLFSTWLEKILRNCIWSRGRRKLALRQTIELENEVDSAETVADTAPLIDERLDEEGRRVLVMRMVASLPPILKAGVDWYLDPDHDADSARDKTRAHRAIQILKLRLSKAA